MPDEVGDVLIPAPEIAARVSALGAALAREYAGREPVLVAVMKGCVLFLADLVRAWPGPVALEFVSAESYRGTQAGEVRVALPPDLGRRVAGRDVLVVDDILDSGRTLAAVRQALLGLGPAEVKTLVLLRKERAQDARGRRGGASADPPPCTPDWVGFDIPDRFVIGYGLDYHGRYRNLPYVAVLRQT